MDELRQGRVTIHLTPPPSVNRIWRSGRSRGGRRQVYRSKTYTDWLKLSEIAVGKMELLPGPVWVRIVVTAGRGWRAGRDLDNAAKAILDLLVRQGLLEDDCAEVVQRLTMIYQAPKRRGGLAGVVVLVRALSEP